MDSQSSFSSFESNRKVEQKVPTLFRPNAKSNGGGVSNCGVAPFHSNHLGQMSKNLLTAAVAVTGP